MPANKQRVLIYVPNNNCYTGNKRDTIEIAVFIKGITYIERMDMWLGKIKDPIIKGVRRSDIECAEDEGVNNKRGYCWQSNGYYWGQEVAYWADLPDEPIE